jgi:aminoglycoside 3-N-acetyltransferase I
MSIVNYQIGPADVDRFSELLDVFGEAFDDAQAYCDSRPSKEYHKKLLARDSFIALCALDAGRVVGGLAAYELHKFEQPRSEIYIYDLGVAT